MGLNIDLNKDCSYLIQGGPGSGKTYFLVQLITKCEYKDEEILVTTFNTDAVDELKRRINRPVTISTTYSLYGKLRHENPLPKWKMTFIDEFQDLAEPEIEFLMEISENIIAVGDSYQDLYSWRKGYNNPFLMFTMSDFRPTKLTLTESYRCRKEIIDFVNSIWLTPWFSISELPGDIKIRRTGSDWLKSFKELKGSKAVLARTNKSIIKFLLEERSWAGNQTEIDDSTIHRAKGQEWDHVAIIDFNVNDWTYPEDGWKIREKEMRNLLYVGASRARETLYIVSEDEHQLLKKLTGKREIC